MTGMQLADASFHVSSSLCVVPAVRTPKSCQGHNGKWLVNAVRPYS